MLNSKNIPIQKSFEYVFVSFLKRKKNKFLKNCGKLILYLNSSTR